MLYSRVSSGLDVIDAAIGGLFSNRIYLTRGPAQSGRTTMGLQFLLAGIENGETGIMISDQRIENVILKAESMGIGLEQYLTDNRLILMEYPKGIMGRQFSFGTIVQLMGEIEQYIRHYNCSRLVFDTLHPLLLVPRQPQVVNYVYSLMNAIEELKVTTMVITGEPSSHTAQRITQLIEDAAVGSFAISTTGQGESTQRRLQILKMIDRITPPYNFRVKMEYGQGLVQDIDSTRTRPGGAQRGTEQLSEVPLNIMVLDNDEETVAQCEDVFHEESEIQVFETEDELQQNMMYLDADVTLINPELPGLRWERLVQTLRDIYPKMPIFLVTGERALRLTGKMARQAGADGLFRRPLPKNDLLNALKKSLTVYRTFDELIQKRGGQLRPDSLPTDFPTSDAAQPPVGEEIDLMSFSDFKAQLARQIWQARQQEGTFALISFKMVYINEISKLPHLPQGLELVRKVAGAINGTLRGSNDAVCRYMDKVVVLLEDSDEIGAQAFSKRVISELRERLAMQLDIHIGQHLNILTATAVYPHDGVVADELLTQVTDISHKFVKTHA